MDTTLTRTMDDVYRQFREMWADGEPTRTRSELTAAVRAANVEPAEITADWLRGLDREWVYGRGDDPFADDRKNREYRRLVATKRAR
jgi:hypothetical protein